MQPPRPPSSAAPPRGVATVLIMLLVGMSLTVAVMAGIYATQASQAVAVAMHGQTQAQLRAWSGAEAVRAYLNQLSTDSQLTTFLAAIGPASSKALTLSGLSGVSASYVSADSLTSPTRITFDIRGTTATGTLAESASTLRVVYAVDLGTPAVSSGSGSGSPEVLRNKGNVKLGGSIAVQKDASDTTAFEISVKGDVNTGGNSITNVSKITATGTVNIGSGSAFSEIAANCDVVTSGSVTVATISAMRHVCMSGSAAATTSATAGGSITAASGYAANGTFNATAGAIGVSACRATGSVANASTGDSATCATPTVNGVDVASGGAKVVATKGSVTIAYDRIGQLDAAGNLTVTSSAVVNNGRIGGTLTKPGWNSSVNVTVQAGYVPTVPAPTPVVVDTETFNANSLESLANYVFKVDGNGFIKVTVRNVAGINDGTYFLGDYGGSQRDYLCTALTAGSIPTVRTCASPATAASTKTICKGFSTSNYCFAYASGTWTLDGSSIAQGVAWFQGHLLVKNGTYYNTFIATGNLSTAGSHITYAPNWAGYSGTVGSTTYAATGICTNTNFPLLKPTQFCSGSSYVASADGGIGNFAMMAGSRADANFADTASYVGGNITLGSSSNVYGNVKAGNEFVSGGSTTIHGAMGALGLGSRVNNSMGGSTTFDRRGPPATFIPMSSGGPGTGSTSASAAGTGSVTLKWSRYL